MIKPEADQAHFATRPDERDLALKLDEAFDVTFGRRHAQLSFWLADPKTHIRERFGLQREVLVIYSQWPETDARVLSAIDEIARAPEFRFRIDRLVALLIHCGQAEATRKLLREQVEWVVVPIHAGELANPQRGDLFLRSSMAEMLGQVDLFGMSSPITSDKYFFGRDELVQMLVSRSVGHQGNWGLFGLRKTGKTSVLFAVRRRLADQDRAVLAEYIDCQNPGIHAQRWWRVLESVVSRLAETLKRERQCEVSVRSGYSENNAATRFSSDVKRLLASGCLEQVVLMLDEIEYMTPGLSGAMGQHWDQGFLPFWQVIRATHQETEGKFTFIVAGVNPACVDRPRFGLLTNPIFQLAVPHYLEPLSADGVRDMVRTIGRYSGLKFAEEVYKYLQMTYGGHPYLIRIACSEAWKATDVRNPRLASTVTVATFAQLRAQITARLSRPIKDILL